MDRWGDSWIGSYILPTSPSPQFPISLSPFLPCPRVSPSLLPGKEEGEGQTPNRKEQEITQRPFDADKVSKSPRP